MSTPVLGPDLSFGWAFFSFFADDLLYALMNGVF
jgi:hypothetical protein